MKTLLLAVLLLAATTSFGSPDIMNELLGNPNCGGPRQERNAAHQKCYETYNTERQACQRDYDVCRGYNNHGHCNDRREKCYERAMDARTRCTESADRKFKDACIAIVMSGGSSPANDTTSGTTTTGGTTSTTTTGGGGGTTSTTTGGGTTTSGTTGNTTGATTGTTTGNTGNACDPEKHYKNQMAQCTLNQQQAHIRCQQDYDRCRSRHSHRTCDGRRGNCRANATYIKNACEANANAVRELRSCIEVAPQEPPPEDPTQGSQ